MTRPEQLLSNLSQVEEKIKESCLKAGRPRDSVELLAVSKFHPADDIAVLASAGQKCFGENYVQEAEGKKTLLSASWPDLQWHMIGNVQRKKAGHVACAYDLIHTLDTPEFADALEKRLFEKNAIQNVLIEVNIGEEKQKAGAKPEELEHLALHVLKNCPHVKIQGLMCLPPFFESGEKARPYFIRLRNLRDELEIQTGQHLPVLSMGMSGDFQVAIEEGATIVRIGTDIFGPRPPKI